VSPTVRSAVILAALALAVLLVGPLVPLLGALALLVAMIVDARAVAHAPSVHVAFPGVLARGVSTRLEIEVAPGPQRRAWIRQPCPAGFSIVPAEGADRLGALLTPALRGRHTLPAPAVRLVGPLGLASWDHSIGAPHELVVYPDLPAARRLARAARTGSLGEPLRQRGPLGIGTEFELVRDHVDGDDIRQMNWLATARLGRPMTNQFRVESERDLLCLIDCGRLMTAPIADRTRLDVALDATAAVTLVAEELGDRCGAVAFDNAVRRTIEPGRRSATSVMRSLFDLQARPVESDYERAFALAGARKRAIVVLFTDLLDERAARAMVAAAAVLARRHSVIVASPSDPAIDELPDREPELPLHVYASAVALHVLAQRAAATARLRHHSDEVVEAPPARFSAACVRAYLRIKSQARA
jgi:uncharacterized protein (DUF58 family)